MEGEKQGIHPQRQDVGQSDNSQMEREMSKWGQCQLQCGVLSPCLPDPCSDIHVPTFGHMAHNLTPPKGYNPVGVSYR